MEKLRHLSRTAFVLAALVLVLAACGTSVTVDHGELPLNDGPAGSPSPAAGACLEGEPDCNDTGDMNTPGPLPLDEPSAGADDQPGPAAGPIITVSEALASVDAGLITVQGFLVADETGARLCEALAESYPPQCGGVSVPVIDYEEMVDVPLQNAQGVTWTDEFLTLPGELVEGIFVVDPASTG